MSQPPRRALPRIDVLLPALCAILTACGGGSSSSSSGGGTVGSSSSSSLSHSAPGGSSSSGTGGGSSSSSSSSPAGEGAGAAAQLAAKLGRPGRLLIGLGTDSSPTDIQSQHLSVDIYTAYLGGGDWTLWNAAPCDYVCVVAGHADGLGAVPMFTQYQMANNGDGVLTGIIDSVFMTTYWARLKTLYQDIATYGKPALVNVEPDFWGFTEQQAGQAADPTKVAALVTLNPDCADLSNDVVGIVGCVIKMARKYAPNAYVGFPPSTWGAGSTSAVIAWMNAIGAQKADFIVAQTLDRDAGCFEVQDANAQCNRGSTTGLYWDESNQTSPNFTEHLSAMQQMHTGIGGLPLIWWQTPLGVPSDTPGGTEHHFRDNRVHYFLTHPKELTAAGGLAVVFSAGSNAQTEITTDGGQFQTLSSAYMAAPAVLP